jgi:hypothetical protein
LRLSSSLQPKSLPRSIITQTLGQNPLDRHLNFQLLIKRSIHQPHPAGFCIAHLPVPPVASREQVTISGKSRGLRRLRHSLSSCGFEFRHGKPQTADRSVKPGRVTSV